VPKKVEQINDYLFIQMKKGSLVNTGDISTEIAYR